METVGTGEPPRGRPRAAQSLPSAQTPLGTQPGRGGDEEPRGSAPAATWRAVPQRSERCEVGYSQPEKQPTFHYPAAARVSRIQPQTIKSHPETPSPGPSCPPAHGESRPGVSRGPPEQAALPSARFPQPPPFPTSQRCPSALAFQGSELKVRAPPRSSLLKGSELLTPARTRRPPPRQPCPEVPQRQRGFLRARSDPLAPEQRSRAHGNPPARCLQLLECTHGEDVKGGRWDRGRRDVLGGGAHTWGEGEDPRPWAGAAGQPTARPIGARVRERSQEHGFTSQTVTDYFWFV